MSRAFRMLMPFTSARRSGSSSIIRSVSSPNFLTIRPASDGPIPLIAPLPRYRSMPSRVVGLRISQPVAFHCLPYCGCSTHMPSRITCSPAASAGSVPTTVMLSRPARICTTE